MESGLPSALLCEQEGLRNGAFNLCVILPNIQICAEILAYCYTKILSTVSSKDVIVGKLVLLKFTLPKLVFWSKKC
jgi:hypothetical protein